MSTDDGLRKAVEKLRTFTLQRDEDVSGVSGTGTVAQGVQFADGPVVIRWIVGEHRSTVVWPNVEAVVAIHGHNGATRLVWDDTAHLAHPVPSDTEEERECTCERPSTDAGRIFRHGCPEHDPIAQPSVAAPAPERCGCPDARDCCAKDADLTPITGGVDESVEIVHAPASGPEQCTECGGLNGSHGLVHRRHPQGGGGVNVPCPAAPAPAPEDEQQEALAEVAKRRLDLLRAVVSYDDANQSDLPLGLLDSIRAEVGGSR